MLHSALLSGYGKVVVIRGWKYGFERLNISVWCKTRERLVTDIASVG